MAIVSPHSTDSFLDSSWLSIPEGQLSIDVLETAHSIIVRSAIAGVRAKDIEITLNDDTLTIRGTRHQDTSPRRGEKTHIQECHWGTFSRSIILPASVSPQHIEATLKQGILTIILRKIEIETNVPVLDLEDL